jgi:tRNA (cmo5U34)-methyltransferase
MKKKEPLNNHFDQVAGEWDQDQNRLRMAENITQALLAAIPFQKNQVILDFGAGTGNVALTILPHVKKVYALDSSPGMLMS